MEYVLIIGDTGFLACKECKYSILPSSISSHFRRVHGLSSELREEILSEIGKYASLILDPKGVKDSTIPSSFPYFFPDLALYTDGLACQDCPYIVRSEDRVRKHYREIHDWENPRKKCRIPKSTKKDVPWKSDIPCQQFFRSPPGHSYFRVNPKRPFTDRETRPRTASPARISENSEGDENRPESSIAFSRASQGIYILFIDNLVILIVYIEPSDWESE